MSTPDIHPDRPGWFGRNWKWALLALVCIPLFTWQSMKDRLSREKDEVVFAVDDQAAGLGLAFNKTNGPGEVVYADGKRLPPDGYGIAVLTLKDFAEQRERLAYLKGKLAESDFPVVIFFNSSGFDGTADPMVARRVADGKLLFEETSRTKLVRAMLPQRDGTFRVHYWGETSFEKVSAKDWYSRFVGIDPVPSKEELEKMTPEQLKALGIDKNEVRPKDKDEGKKENRPPTSLGPSGVRGEAIYVGGNPAVQPIQNITLILLKGKVEPTKDIKESMVAARVKTAKDGTYAAELPPGVYTMIASLDTKIFGNAINPKVWPYFTVKENAWVDYEFRVSHAFPPRGD